MVSIARQYDDIASDRTVASWRTPASALTLVNVPQKPVSAKEQDYRRRLGPLIVDMREAARMSQATLSSLVERSEAALSRWENSKATPTAYDLVRLAEIFELTVTEYDLLIDPPEPRRSEAADRLAMRPRPEHAAAALSVLRSRLPEIEADASALRRSRSVPGGPSARQSGKSPAPAKRG